jgi:hypothetical protein
LHADYVVEQAPWRLSAGVAFAIATSGADDGGSAADAAATSGAFARGLWNAWWYITNAWALVVPASLEHDTDTYELGADAALAWFLPRDDRRDNQGTFQLGGHAAAVAGMGVFGLRLNGVLMLDDGFLGEDRFQLSAEPYLELRLPIVWLGLGLNVPLDKPLGVFDGLDYWALRVSGGASF